MKALTTITLTVLLSVTHAHAENAPTSERQASALDNALMETIVESEVQEKSFHQAVHSPEEDMFFEEASQGSTILQITTGVETLPPPDSESWNLEPMDWSTEGSPVSF